MYAACFNYLLHNFRLYLLSDLFVRRGVPTCIRSDNGSEFTATKIREWLARVGVKTLFIEPGSPAPCPATTPARL